MADPEGFWYKAAMFCVGVTILAIGIVAWLVVIVPMTLLGILKKEGPIT